MPTKCLREVLLQLVLKETDNITMDLAGVISDSIELPTLFYPLTFQQRINIGNQEVDLDHDTRQVLIPFH